MSPTGERPVLVTGAAGFVGAALVERLRARGTPTVGADLRPAPGVDRTFDITDGPETRRALRELSPRVVVHGAALVDDRLPAGLFERVNVFGTRTVLDACVGVGGVERFVQVSSIAALGVSPPPGQTDASPPATLSEAPYFGTKARSEALVRAAIARGDIPGVIVRPGDVYGPGSEPWVERPLELLRAGLPVLVGGGMGVMSPAHIENLIDGIELALDHPAALGGTFTIHDGAPVTYRVYMEALADAAGLPISRVAPPRALMMTAARLGQVLARSPLSALAPEAPMSPSGVAYVTRQSTYDIDHARRVLGYTPRIDLADGMRRLAAVLRP